MEAKTEKRRAMRIALNVPTKLEAIGNPQGELHENLQRVYERIEPAQEPIGQKKPGILRDLSTNGAFIAGEPLPLLSRVHFIFQLEGYGPVEAIAWTLWRRRDDCHVPRPDGTTALLPRGFGVLFEAIPLDARLAIHKLVTSSDTSG